MEKRISSLLLPIVIGVVGFLLVKQCFNGSKTKPADRARRQVTPWDPTKAAMRVGAPGSRESFTRRVGSRGLPGSYDLEFEPVGAELVRAKLLDYYDEAGLDDDEKASGEHDYVIIAPEQSWLHSFAVGDYNRHFPVRKRAGADDFAYIQQQVWERIDDPDGRPGVRFRLALDNGVTFEKDFLFSRASPGTRVDEGEEGRREIELVFRVRNTSDENAGRWRWLLRGAAALPLGEGSGGLIQVRPLVFGAVEGPDGLRIESKSPDGKENPANLPDVARTGPGEAFVYAGSTNRFFACVLYPADDETAASVSAVEIAKLPTGPQRGGDRKVGTNGSPLLTVEQRIPHVPDGVTEAQSERRFRIYLGPKLRELFAEDPAYESFLAFSDLDLQPGCCAPGARPMAKFLLLVLRLFYSVFGNWGVAIILLTILVRSGMLPLNLRQQKTMRVYQEKMGRLKPEMDKIRERLKKNQQKMNQELMKFQKEHKLFPPLMGCLPMFLTMPVFIGLFTMLRASFELRHEPFLGWIQDLSMPDRLVHFGAHGIPLVPEYLNVLPLLMMTFWVVNSLNMPLPEEPQQRSMQRVMRWMPLVFGVLLYNYASGLALYMTVSSVWSFVETRIIRKKLGAVAGIPQTF